MERLHAKTSGLGANLIYLMAPKSWGYCREIVRLEIPKEDCQQIGYDLTRDALHNGSEEDQQKVVDMAREILDAYGSRYPAKKEG